MSDISFTIMWHDSAEPFCQVSITCTGDNVIAKNAFYVMDKNIIELSEILYDFSYIKIDNFKWDTVDFELTGTYMDALGHIQFEVFMIVDDNPKHSCIFTLSGIEPAMIERFARKLKILEIGEYVNMNDTDIL